MFGNLFNQKKYILYTVYLHEAAAGLNEKSPVKYNGVPVGFVKQIQLNKNDQPALFQEAFCQNEYDTRSLSLPNCHQNHLPL